MNPTACKGRTPLRRAILATLGATALAVAGMGAAYAGPIVTTWTYDASSVFDTAATTFTLGPRTSPSYCATTNSATKLSWGCPQGSTNPDKQSSLVINPSSATGNTATTYTGSGTPPDLYISNPGVVLTHNNFPIVAGPGDNTWNSLATASLVTTINFTNPNDVAGNPFALTFNIKFDETPNIAGTCPVNPTAGNIPCPDIFVFSADALNQSFVYDGNTYFLSLFPTDASGNLGTLPAAACAAAGASAGCFGFVTQENKSNPLNFGLTISTHPIITTPEPGDLGIMGLGLLGLGGLLFYRRRNRSVDPVA